MTLDPAVLAELAERAAVRADEPLSRHTAWRTGGRCAAFVVVHDMDGLGGVLDVLRGAQLKWAIVGAGTRDVMRDGDRNRVMIRLGTEFGGLTFTDDDAEVGAWTPCPALAWGAALAGLGGLGALARTPGSVGAAVSLDGGPWRERLREVAIWRRGAVRWVDADTAKGHKLVLGARFALERGESARWLAACREALTGAAALPSWYGVLKGGSAETELRKVDAAGVRLRGVVIPRAAPEMVVNVGRGPAKDLNLLHRSALKRVQQLRGVELTSAVRWCGRA